MSPRIPLLPGDPPDELDLDLLELGAVTEGTDRARIEAARRGLLAEADRELADARELFRAEARPLPTRSTRSPRWTRTVWRWAPVVALAAAALLVLGLVPPPSSDGVRPMGRLPVELTVKRDGAPVPPPWAFVAEDQLFIHLRSPGEGYLDVWTRQADGIVSPLVVAQPVQTGERVTLPGAIQLDPYGDEEWLMMQLTPDPSTAAGLDALRPETLDRTTSFAIEVTRGP